MQRMTKPEKAGNALHNVGMVVGFQVTFLLCLYSIVHFEAIGAHDFYSSIQTSVVHTT